MSKLIQLLLTEMDNEASTTRKMLSKVPNDKWDWQPHPKSMTLRNLATHVAELPTWVDMALNTEGLDFSSNPYDPKIINKSSELLEHFEHSLKLGRDQLRQADEGRFDETWTLRNGDTVLYSSSRYAVIRMTFCQIVHHRAQLGVYLRLLNIPIPGSYGPSADEHEFAPSEEMAV